MYTRLVAAGLAFALLCSCGRPEGPTPPTPAPTPKTSRSELPAAPAAGLVVDRA